MGLFGKLTSTAHHPDSGVGPLPGPQVEAALLAVDSPDVPYVVRKALPSERADLVAVWEVPRLRVTLRTRMRLIHADHEVRSIDEKWDRREREYGRGQVTAVTRFWEFERGPDGRRHRKEVFRFDPSEMKTPLRNAVLGAGWTWRGMKFRL
ncbi:hypothetical protein ACFWWT_07385 [Streptomyces sp. NPDC058676]|uniref:hypothetical protein n=1 Tax=unclassified Streptomyces TaxID=2593676 RepID=UPI00365761EF